MTDIDKIIKFLSDKGMTMFGDDIQNVYSGLGFSLTEILFDSDACDVLEDHLNEKLQEMKKASMEEVKVELTDEAIGDIMRRLGRHNIEGDMLTIYLDKVETTFGGVTEDHDLTFLCSLKAQLAVMTHVERVKRIIEIIEK